MTKTVAFHTLGCKVNQYDTQAMLEIFKAHGYEVVPFHEKADVYVLNTCTVTGTGDKKSIQLARRLRRTYPESAVVLCGCLAQRKGKELLETGARLIVGTQRRGEVVDLLEQALSEGTSLCAVNELNATTPFESLSVTAQEEHSRAILKIQEGCNNHCSYCIIPSVRGPIRSRPLQDVAAEAKRLADAGFVELVVTGIHLASYGRDLKDGTSLLDALQILQDTPGILRIRLGSLEPIIATPAFAEKLKQMDKICPQFHLALQSGSSTVLARMQRQYNAAQYLRAVENLRAAFPHAAFTTDVLTGFPGETTQEVDETREMIRKVAFARIHVFPYSPREGTKAAVMPGQLSTAEKETRARSLIALGNEMSEAYQHQWLGRTSSVLLEKCENGFWVGYTPEYIRVSLADCPALHQGQVVDVRLTALCEDGMMAELV